MFDDAARPEYKNDPRVHFVGGHPVLRGAMPQLLRGLGVELPAKAVQKAEQIERRVEHSLEFGGMARKAANYAAPAAVAALAVLGGLMGAGMWARKSDEAKSRR